MDKKEVTPDLWLEILPGLPANIDIYRFFEKGTRFFSEGLVIRFVDKHKGEWIGNFQLLDPPTYFTDIFNHPKDSHICVVASGQAYIVNINSPENYYIEEVPSITNVIERDGRLIYITHCYMYSYGSMGLLWRTKQIALDGITVQTIEKDFIVATAYSPTTSFLYEFKLDLRTGEIVESIEKKP